MRGMRRRRALACRVLFLSMLAAGGVERAACAAGTDPSQTSGPPQPLREYTDSSGRLCRVYLRKIVIDGKAETAYATVCRDADGRWVLSR
ncbi:MAG TPA: hypothetical protein VN668_01010 [Stellaceae bacterium]|nr:hypothetical protein [Stellaceae bacterium]